MQDILYMIAGLVILVIGGEGVVRGSVSVAKALGLSTLLISVVIVGFGTSMPELVVSVQAAFAGAPDISLGNVVGSNICNTVLVLGAASVIFPICCKSTAIKRDILVGILAALSLALISFLDEINRIAGIAMFGSLAAYLAYCVWHDKKVVKSNKHKAHEIEIADEVDEFSYKMIVALPMAIFGIAMLMGGAKLLVMGATSIAEKCGVSEAVIGLTVIALGTSLPELATAIVAARKKHSDVIIGNILGSNLFNILAILGITSIITPISYKGQIAEQDVWIMLAIVTLLAPISFIWKKIGRTSGALLLTLYVGYIGYLAMGI